VTGDSSSLGARERFFTTRWSVVARAGSGSREAREALESLCAGYWYPLYAYARRRGLDHHAAQDAVQGFFARLIEKQDLAAADRARGRFRSFLLAALSNFLANSWDRERAEKRGGALARLSIDEAEAQRRYAGDFAVSDAPEKLFERQWARELLARALAALEGEWKRAGREALFARLKPFLTSEASGTEQAGIARDLALTENAVRIALHRQRKRFGELLRLEVADTVSDPGDVERELAELLDALGS
jgi:DNA-directed RNA polymerase specialized sigma24 family protein